MAELERRYAELRLDGRTLTGFAVRYGDVARLPWGSERVEPGAFRFDDVVLNAMHERAKPIARTPDTLALVESAEGLAVRAELPETRDADDALANVRAKVFRGFSVEFLARAERREGGVRVIEAAELVGLAVVDRPAYTQSTVAARRERARQRWL